MGVRTARSRPATASEFHAQKSSPQEVAHPLGVEPHSMPLEVAAHVGEVARKQLVGARIAARINSLWEIDDGNRAVPVEDVVGREVAMDDVEAEKELDVVHDGLKNRPNLLRQEPNLLQL